MRYQAIGSSLFIQNRKSFTSQLKANSLAVFNSNDIYPTSADGVMPFIQHSDIFYLSGIDQEETILVLFPDATRQEWKEVLFVRETSEEIAIWEGHKLTKDAARQISGIQTIYWVHEFKRVFREMVLDSENIYLNTNEHTRSHIETPTRDRRFIDWCKNHFPLHHYYRSAPILNDIRAVKSAIELSLLQQACDITEKGFRRVLNFVKPQVMEYEIEAEYIHEFVRSRSRGFGYDPIIASGQNACVLHYIENNQVCQDGDVILMDVGAEYANYSADMTRCIPVNGRFTDRQKAVYNAVLSVMRDAMTLLTPDHSLNEYHKEVGLLMEKQLVDLGLISLNDIKNQDPKKPAYRKYFMHGASHYLGLNVHDYGRFDRKIEAGMVFTCEPGIYIQEEGLGIRLENNLVITNNGFEDLMKHIPIEVEEIEDLMNA